MKDVFAISSLIFFVMFSGLSCKTERKVSSGNKPSVPNQVLKQVETANKVTSRGEISYAVPEGWIGQ